MKVVTVNYEGSKGGQIDIWSELLRKPSPSAISRRITKRVLSPCSLGRTGWEASRRTRPQKASLRRFNIISIGEVSYSKSSSRIGVEVRQTETTP